MKLVLYLTLGGSLKQWQDLGILDREMALYKHHVDAGWYVDIISYGDSPEEAQIAAKYDGVSVHFNKWRLHPRLYNILIPILHQSSLAAADGYKTNQMYGAHHAAAAARIWNKPLVIRQGYGHFLNRQAESGEASKSARKALAYERRALKAARGTIVSTQTLSDHTTQTCGVPSDQVAIIPNYVDTRIWMPGHRQGTDGTVRLIYFGRLSEEKNLPNLLKACSGLSVHVTLIGRGPQREQLQQLASEQGTRCTFLPQMSPRKLRKKLAEADVFVLPSFYEGHPKALIEAMCTGILTLGANSPGIREILGKPGRGVLSGTAAHDLRDALKQILQMPISERQRLGEAGSTWARECFDVAKISRRERQVLTKFWQPQQ